MNLFPSVKIRRLREKAMRAAMQHLRDGHKAEDAAQDAMVSYCKVKLAGRVLENTSAFVWRLGVHKAIDLIRRDRKYRSLNDTAAAEPADNRPTPHQQALAKVAGEIVRTRLQDLPEAERIVFEMLFFEERTRSEIAAKTGWSSCAIGSLYYRAKVRLGILEQPSGRRRRS